MKVILGICAAALIALASTGPAAAAGCNGVVNPAVWGCAPWDNNNGPQYPNYKPPARSNAPAPRIVGGGPAGQVNNATKGATNRSGAYGYGGIVAGGAGN